MMNPFFYAVFDMVLDVSVNVFRLVAKHAPAAADSYRRNAEPCHGSLAFYL
jgi:hypothetical protein